MTRITRQMGAVVWCHHSRGHMGQGRCKIARTVAANQRGGLLTVGGVSHPGHHNGLVEVHPGGGAGLQVHLVRGQGHHLRVWVVGVGERVLRYPSHRCSASRRGSGTRLFSSLPRKRATMVGISMTRLTDFWQVSVAKQWTSSGRNLARSRMTTEHCETPWSRGSGSWSPPPQSYVSYCMCDRRKVSQSRTLRIASLWKSKKHIWALTLRWSRTWRKKLFCVDARTAAQHMQLQKRIRKHSRMLWKRSKIPSWIWRYLDVGVQWRDKSVSQGVKKKRRKIPGWRRRKFGSSSRSSWRSDTVRGMVLVEGVWQWSVTAATV